MKERLQKILSTQGICSRRTAEQYLQQGRVKVNGLPAKLGDSADSAVDIITLDDEKIITSPALMYVMLHKPRGYVTTLQDEAGRNTVAQLVEDAGTRLYPVGRLDLYSEGLLLMTNDGDLTFRLTHPSHEVYKEYLLKISGGAPEDGMEPHQRLSQPMKIDGQQLLPAKCRLIRKTEKGYILTVSIREGKNRQIRKMCAQCGYTVHSLKRVSIGKLKLGDLPAGKWRELTEQEVTYLKSL